MTREDIAATLRALEEGDPSAPLSTRSRVALAKIVADQEARLTAIDLRLRALEDGSRR